MFSIKYINKNYTLNFHTFIKNKLIMKKLLLALAICLFTFSFSSVEEINEKTLKKQETKIELAMAVNNCSAALDSLQLAADEAYANIMATAYHFGDYQLAHIATEWYLEESENLSSLRSLCK